MSKDGMIEISGLWLNKSKSGVSYMVGYMGGAKILIFKNEYKTSDDHPDYRLMVVAKEYDKDSKVEEHDIEF